MNDDERIFEMLQQVLLPALKELQRIVLEACNAFPKEHRKEALMVLLGALLADLTTTSDYHKFIEGVLKHYDYYLDHQRMYVEWKPRQILRRNE